MRALLFAAAGVLASGQVDGPKLGYLAQDGAVRPVYGMPAAAAVASPVGLGASYEHIVASPSRDFLIASRSDTGQVVRLAGDGTSTPWAGVRPHPSKIVVGTTGQSAAFWFDSSAAQITDLSGNTREADFSFLGSAPNDLAVSSDAAWIAGTWPDGIWASGPNGEVRHISIPGVTRIAFQSSGHGLAAFAAGEVLFISDIDAAPTPRTLYNFSPKQINVGLGAWGTNIVVAERGGEIAVLDPAGSTPRLSRCGCTPDRVESMGGSLFRLTPFANGAFRLLDAAAGDTWFVPAAGESATKEGSLQ